MTGPRLRAYHFPPDADFEGRLVGAVERMLLTADAGLCDALFVTRDARTGEPLAIDLATARGGGTAAAMLDFRLDERRRRALTSTTLARGAGGVDRAVIAEVAAALEPGAAILAVLATAEPTAALQDAVTRTGGKLVADEPVGATRLADLEPRILTGVTPPIHST